MLITEFYDNQDIFITGGSGFIGRVLIEKLLRSCPDIRKIYLLMRPKKGRNPKDRLKDLVGVPLFEQLGQEQPDYMEKLEVIDGDISKNGVGISEQDLHKLRNVSVIFHSAATVRFDEYLEDAIVYNARGTYEMMKLSESFKNLRVFVHVSTTYCYPREPVLQEKINPSTADWKTALKMVGKIDSETLNILFAKYSDDMPNTYSFTKNLSEQVVNDFKGKLPIIVVRPAVVVCTLREPFTGWIDNFNGPLGLLIGCGMGIVRTNYVVPNNYLDMIPVDIVVKALIIAAFKKGVESAKCLPPPSSVTETAVQPAQPAEIPVYNCAITDRSAIGLGDFIESCKYAIRQTPFENTLWVPGGSVTRNFLLHIVRVIIYHILMALMIDSILWVGGKKPMILKLQRRIKYAFNVTNVFSSRPWYFSNAKFYSLENEVAQKEKQKFSFIDDCSFDYQQFVPRAIHGCKMYLLKEGRKSSKAAFIKLHTFRVINKLFEFYVGYVCLRYVYTFLQSYLLS